MSTPAIGPKVSATPIPGSKHSRATPDQGAAGSVTSIADNFSIVVGGPVYDLLWRLRLVRVSLPNVLRRVLVLVALTWLPLVVLSLKDGLAFGHQVKIPLLLDVATYARFLLALPLFVLAEVVIDPGIRLAVTQFINAGIVQNGVVTDFENVLKRVQKLRDSIIPELILFALAFLPVFLFEHEWAAGAISSWHTTAQGMTAAGWWYAVFSAPVLRFILYRWAFRYFVWTVLVWRISRLDLVLTPTHPDRAAGLNFLCINQQAFGILFCALGCTFAGRMANSLVFEGAKIESFKFLMAGFVAMSLIVSLAPLAVVAPKLMILRWKGLLEYGKLANNYTQAFDRKWVHRLGENSEPLLGTSDIQSLADMGNSFAFVDAMRIAPISKILILQLVAQAALPLIPVILIATPMPELVRALIKMIA